MARAKTYAETLPDLAAKQSALAGSEGSPAAPVIADISEAAQRARLECLKIAQRPDWDDGRILRKADALSRFVLTGELPAFE